MTNSKAGINLIASKLHDLLREYAECDDCGSKKTLGVYFGCESINKRTLIAIDIKVLENKLMSEYGLTAAEIEEIEMF